MKIHQLSKFITCAALALVTTACIARGPDDYRQVTRSVVDTKQAEIEGCFGGAPGTVTVNFTVAKKTGTISEPSLDADASDTPPEVGECILAKIDGMAIEPADMRDGAAAFTWTLTN